MLARSLELFIFAFRAETCQAWRIDLGKVFIVKLQAPRYRNFRSEFTLVLFTLGMQFTLVCVTTAIKQWISPHEVTMHA